MTPEHETILFSDLKYLVRAVDDIRKTQELHTAQIACLDGRMSDMPTTRDFSRLEGWVAEMSQRLPTTLAYVQPKPAA